MLIAQESKAELSPAPERLLRPISANYEVSLLGCWTFRPLPRARDKVCPRGKLCALKFQEEWIGTLWEHAAAYCKSRMAILDAERHST